MADMELVIKIPEEEYVRICDEPCTELAIAVRNGTPLPKGHGKIGDIDRLYEVFLRNVVGAPVYKQLFVNAPTIIEADKEGDAE